MQNEEFVYDVLVVGAGNAGFAAVHAARELGVTVGLLEKAPVENRGGNSALTGHLRFAYDNVDQLMDILGEQHRTDEVRSEFQKRLPQRTAQELWDEIMLVTDGMTDQELLRVHIAESYRTIAWLHSKGHDWVPSYEDATTGNIVHCEGMGYGLQERNFAICVQDEGVTIHYQTSAQELLRDDLGKISGVAAMTPNGLATFRAKAVVLSSGGFEANPEMRARYLGQHWDDVYNRGVPYNTGDGLRMALDVGAMPYGGWGSCHASPNDWAMPAYALPAGFGGGAMPWVRYLYPYSIMVNTQGRRFVDEADNIRGLTYAKMGRSILEQPGGKAFQIIDAKVRSLGLVPPVYATATGVKADTLTELAKEIGVDPNTLEETVAEYNAAVPTDRDANPNAFHTDGVGTIGLTPPKSNYAMTIADGPFEAYAVRCGITFTFGGVKIDPETAQVQGVSGLPIDGLYAAGEMVGGLWYWNYPSGSGMMAGATFGRKAGTHAAKTASNA
jgi:tricarballylate dehydrogenase